MTCKMWCQFKWLHLILCKQLLQSFKARAWFGQIDFVRIKCLLSLFLITACSMVIPCPTPSSCLCIFVILCQEDRHSCTDPKDAALAKVLRGQSFWAWRSGTQGVDNAYSPTHTAPPPFFSLHCSYFLWSAVSYSDFFVMKYCICLFHILYLRWEYLNTHSVLIIA